MRLLDDIKIVDGLFDTFIFCLLRRIWRYL